MGIELKAKQLIGISKKNKARVKRLSLMFITKGESENKTAHHLSTDLYPMYFENLVAMSTKIEVGMMTQSKRKELVFDVTYEPVFFR